MLKLILIGGGLMALTVLIHTAGTVLWIRFLQYRWGDRGRHRSRIAFSSLLVSTVVVLLGLHLVQVLLWALCYRWLDPTHQLESFESVVYFSLVTFTTLGYGDITLGPDWRLLSGIEALNGIMLVGWTTAMLFAVLQRYWVVNVSDELERGMTG